MCGRWVAGSGAVGCNLIEGHTHRDVVVGHDVLHLACVLRYVLAVVLLTGLHPLGVVPVELALIVNRQHSVPTLRPAVGTGILRRACRNRYTGKTNQQSRES